MQQQLDFLVESPGIGIHFHPGVFMKRHHDIVLCGNDQLCGQVGEHIVDARFDQIQWNEFGMPVDCQNGFLSGINDSGGQNLFNLFR